jgi:hypothetical protein
MVASASVAPPYTNMQKFISQIDPAVERVWRENRCLTESTIALYRMWVRCFVEHCRAMKIEINAQLTLAGVSAFVSRYSRIRKRDAPAIRHRRSGSCTRNSSSRIGRFPQRCCDPRMFPGASWPLTFRAHVRALRGYEGADYIPSSPLNAKRCLLRARPLVSGVSISQCLSA